MVIKDENVNEETIFDSLRIEDVDKFTPKEMTPAKIAEIAEELGYSVKMLQLPKR